MDELLDVDDMIGAVLNKKCRLETTDGSIRVENVIGADTRTIMVGLRGEEQDIEYPVTLFFDHAHVDGVELHTLRSIEVLGDID